MIKQFSLGLMILALPLFVVLNSLNMVAFDIDFYSNEFEKHAVPVEDKIMLSENLMGYLKGNNELSNVFNAKENQHMEDVKGLFRKGKMLLALSALFLMTGIFLIYSAEKRLLGRYVLIASTVSLVILILLSLIFTDFSSSFAIFHQWFFESGTWIFNPETDVLIQLFPMFFFMDLVVRVVLLSFSQLVLISLAGFILQKKKLIYQKHQ